MFEPAGNLHVQELQAQHETFKNTTLKEGDGYYEALNGLAEQLAAASTSENPYTGHTPQVGGMVGDTGGPHAERWGMLALVHCSGCPLHPPPPPAVCVRQVVLRTGVCATARGCPPVRAAEAAMYPNSSLSVVCVCVRMK